MIESEGSAGSQEKTRSRSRRRNDRRNRNRNRNRTKNNFKVAKERVPGPDCPICEKQIRDISAAINDNQTDKPAHFDCILKRISDNEKLENQEKVIYLGSGSFGVVKIINNKKFEVIKKIPYENMEEGSISWRKDMRLDFPENPKKAP